MTAQTKTELVASLAADFANTKSGLFHTVFRAFLTNLLDSATSDFIRITEDGSLAVRLTNGTGAASVKGTLVTAGTSFMSFVANPADAPKPIGAVYEGDVANGELCWVAILGFVQVLLEDSTSSTAGNWVKMSDNDAGRADATNLTPPGGTIQALEDHLSEIGHCLESVTAGTDKLCWTLMHFN